MKLIAAFFRLIRWNNLIFIIITQFLFYYFIILPSFADQPDSGLKNNLAPFYFYLLCVSSVMIAAAGYIINDYFDLNIDRVNKPNKLVVEKIIKRRWTILWHWILSGIGVIIGAYISWKIHNPIIVLSDFACALLLWFYSTTFKRKLMIGNIIVSLLTAWVIMVLYFCEFSNDIFLHPVYHQVLSRIFKFAVLYAGFAFIISLVREVVKDIEDMEGDAAYNCRTMPILWGINVSKIFAATWLIVLIASLIIIQFYVLQYRWWWAVLYCSLLIVLPLLFVMRNLYRASTVSDYHNLSNFIKIIMITGVLSMLFF
ncbi:MAG TPA: geranylgeranylglycerol-phosphate geranylgeranyltransferase [Puia sp.]|nr:geranylgeranylglycerol-phosphate geranylgeranyltransferase [Puia sp.]